MSDKLSVEDNIKQNFLEPNAYLFEFRFWYRFVPDNTASIQRGLANNVYQKIAPQIPSFMGGVFEEICKQYLWARTAQGKATIPFLDLGRWWGNDPRSKSETEIDIMGTIISTS